MSFVFRIHGPSGRFRVTVPTSCSLQELYKNVAEQCHFEKTSDFMLYMEPDFRKHVRHSPSLTVGDSDSGLSNGQVLYAKMEGSNATTLPEGDIVEGLSETGSFPQHGRAVPSRFPSSLPSNSVSPINLSTSNTGIPSAGEPLKPRFKAFDQYLKERAYNTVDLPLNQSYLPRELIRGQPNIEQRAGWLFGYFKEDRHYPLGIRAVVEAIYEPPQVFESGNVILLDDPFLETAKTVAASLGLELVGWILTHLPREELLTSDEVQRIAQLQLDHMTTSHYTGYPVSSFVTVTVALDLESNGEVSTNAYMVSDLGMAFQRDGILAESPDPRRMQLRVANKNELLPDLLESGKSTATFDPDWLIVRVNDSAPKQINSLFQSWSFPVENRQKPLGPSDIPIHLRSCLPSSSSSSAVFSDWHLLLYIARLFDAQTASAVCEKILRKEPVDPALVETFKML